MQLKYLKIKQNTQKENQKFVTNFSKFQNPEIKQPNWLKNHWFSLSSEQSKCRFSN